METSIMLAKVFGVLYLTIGISFLLHTKSILKGMKSFVNCDFAVLYSGVLSLVIGLFLIEYHNIWVKDWTVIITILSWSALIKGFCLMLAPKYCRSMMSFYTYKNIRQYIIPIVLLLGIVLTYFGLYS